MDFLFSPFSQAESLRLSQDDEHQSLVTGNALRRHKTANVSSETNTCKHARTDIRPRCETGSDAGLRVQVRGNERCHLSARHWEMTGPSAAAVASRRSRSRSLWLFVPPRPPLTPGRFYRHHGLFSRLHTAENLQLYTHLSIITTKDQNKGKSLPVH